MESITIQEVIDRLDKFTGDERAEYLPRLFKVLSDLSTNQLINFQDSWDGERPFGEFRKKQDAEIIKCIRLEISKTGLAVRELMGLPPINLDTKI